MGIINLKSILSDFRAVNKPNMVSNIPDVNNTESTQIIDKNKNVPKLQIPNNIQHKSDVNIIRPGLVRYTVGDINKNITTINHKTDFQKRLVDAISHNTSVAINKVLPITFLTSFDKQQITPITHKSNIEEVINTDIIEHKSSVNILRVDTINHKTNVRITLPDNIEHTSSITPLETDITQHVSNTKVNRVQTITHDSDTVLNSPNNIKHDSNIEVDKTLPIVFLTDFVKTPLSQIDRLGDRAFIQQSLRSSSIIQLYKDGIATTTPLTVDNSLIQQQYRKYDLIQDAYNSTRLIQEPLITTGIQNNSNNIIDNVSILGDVPLVGDSLEEITLDTIRRSKFLATGRGLRFLTKQVILERLNSMNGIASISIYNPTSLLSTYGIRLQRNLVQQNYNNVVKVSNLQTLFRSGGVIYGNILGTNSKQSTSTVRFFEVGSNRNISGNYRNYINLVSTVNNIIRIKYLSNNGTKYTIYDVAQGYISVIRNGNDIVSVQNKFLVDLNNNPNVDVFSFRSTPFSIAENNTRRKVTTGFYNFIGAESTTYGGYVVIYDPVLSDYSITNQNNKYKIPDYVSNVKIQKPKSPLTVVTGNVDPIYTDPTTPDFVNLIFDISGQKVKFRSFIKQFSDQGTGNWSNVQIQGRADQSYIYSNYDRTASLTFTVVAFSRQELKLMWQHIQKLYRTILPTYSSNGMLGTVVRFTLGDMFHDKHCIITNVSYDISNENTWEINLENDQNNIIAPQYVDINISMILLGVGAVPQNVESFKVFSKKI